MNNTIAFLQNRKYELLLLALLQHLFIGIFLTDLHFYTRVVWPINMLILGLGSISELNDRISKARDMYLSDKIDEDDFRDIKNRYKGELDDLEYKLSVLVKSEQKEGVEDKISKALKIVGNISERYRNASTIEKRALVSLMYPEKIIFDGSYF